MDIEHALESVLTEYKEATREFGAFKSAHEGLAIIQEEFEELKAEVFHRDESRADMRHEAKQLAAMTIRFLVDIC